MTPVCVRIIVISALSVTAFQMVSAFGAERDDNESLSQVAVSLSENERENFAEASETEDVKQTRTATANDKPVESNPHPYVSYGCYQCHGYLGQGGGASGPRLSALVPYEAFRQFVRFPSGVMPAYPRELLSDEDLREMYSYIEALPPPPEVKDLPLLYDTSK